MPAKATQVPPTGVLGRPVMDVIPGRWVGGVAMVIAPVLLLVGVLLRVQFHFFFPDQLAAFQAHPTLSAVSYSIFAAGTVLLWPAVLALATRIGATRPNWALWGGALVMFGLFARTFHAGVDHLAFELARLRGTELATDVVAEAYGTFQVFEPLHAAIFFGWIVLAIGAWRSGTLGLVRSVALGLMAGLPQGILKGTRPFRSLRRQGCASRWCPWGSGYCGTASRPACERRWAGSRPWSS